MERGDLVKDFSLFPFSTEYRYLGWGKGSSAFQEEKSVRMLSLICASSCGSANTCCLAALLRYKVRGMELAGRLVYL